jgi:hypothetical protein
MAGMSKYTSQIGPVARREQRNRGAAFAGRAWSETKIGKNVVKAVS